jgi:hypothetical protein
MAGADTSTPIRRRKRSAGCAVTRAVKAAGTVAIPAMTSRRLMSTSPSGEATPVTASESRARPRCRLVTDHGVWMRYA